MVSTAAAPILSKNRVLGIIVVGSRKFYRFTKREIRLLTAFGSQLGAALENAELYHEVAKGKAYIENLVENAGDAVVSTDIRIGYLLGIEPPKSFLVTARLKPSGII